MKQISQIQIVLSTFREEKTTFHRGGNDPPYRHVVAEHNTQAPLPSLLDSVLKELLLSKAPQLTVGC